ncbi:peptidoglycan editing factor PgeF [Cellulomonas chengniuliangii]|uniref:Purine nucleoside phosphorylase n=1 Tax=Cellulomonas chengniuliangii TaxID=2968084 RepID=A0ABY5KWK3_9CELL|nr:peptidoglycan editing factor PgeF [Cellulomonas chengniuliangii]MCC2310221.1 peptidoglycan editing factor PgeF [Cellulomonas chengniuliangii]MCC2319146.1 peptidoglycan editing factor PgeF [Cellulomonas chengniuliangii]UUI74115.1 peptidoglycan editing factor PgeF [Cellulomonas chengniuliangii]
MIPVLEVDLGPGVRAGFTTRAGGVSGAPWASLNVGLNVGDRPADVLANRGLLAEWAGAPVMFGEQVHGATVRVLDEAGSAHSGVAGEADALLTGSSRFAVAVYVADCVPLLLADAQAGLVAAVHAGRAGLAAGVVQAAVDTMLARGADVGRVRASIGPCISGDAYEVPEQMRADVAAVVPEAWAVTRWGTPGVDLGAGVAGELARAGVRAVSRVSTCTFTDERLYSHRRASAEGRPTGRFAGVVRLAG